MKTAGPSVTITGVTWLIREWLELGPIVNLGHGCDAEADIDDEARLGPFRDLKRSIEAGGLETAAGDRVAGFRVGISIHGFAQFLAAEGRWDKDQWAWARNLCERWADARGLDIDALTNLAGVKVHPYKTGAQGRPKGSHLVLDEFLKRVAAGEIEMVSLAEQARVLLKWYDMNHPKGPNLKTVTIEGTIRSAYNTAKKASK